MLGPYNIMNKMLEDCINPAFLFNVKMRLFTKIALAYLPAADSIISEVASFYLVVCEVKFISCRLLFGKLAALLQ